ncbi:MULTISPECIES: DNA-binding protein [Cyanophyceae]|uniref:DNA-binding protein n=1 Tax=Cyanophyceae TaxID=3028117 RepID=UPI00168943D1|nr:MULTISPECIES: DNA-binding protein [Cyanophyceae]MBD1917428.1 DNA-binding protein [Phormidium sp. FACHB-77]MBD2032327.1 DNA-binding protein [Phormidium sp. FACHB-322]MBD2052265.1 DNA-binding protein [Leptolyngbya sp. FACHB-60]
MAKTDWCYPSAAADRLQIYVLKLGKLRRAGAFKEGYHYRDVSPPGAARATYQYHVPRVEALLNSKSATRKRYG